MLSYLISNKKYPQLTILVVINKNVLTVLTKRRNYVFLKVLHNIYLDFNFLSIVIRFVLLLEVSVRQVTKYLAEVHTNLGTFTVEVSHELLNDIKSTIISVYSFILARNTEKKYHYSTNN